MPVTPSPRRKPALVDPGPSDWPDPKLRAHRNGGESPRHRPDVDSIDREPEASARPQAGPHPQGGESTRGRTLPASIEPMLHIDDLAALLSCSRRLVERMRSAGKLPKPDIHVGRCPRWKPATIRDWIERSAKP